MIDKDQIYKARVIGFGPGGAGDGTQDPEVEICGQSGYVVQSHDTITGSTSNAIRESLEPGDVVTVKYMDEGKDDAPSFTVYPQSDDIQLATEIALENPHMCFDSSETVFLGRLSNRVSRDAKKRDWMVTAYDGDNRLHFGHLRGKGGKKMLDKLEKKIYRQSLECFFEPGGRVMLRKVGGGDDLYYFNPLFNILKGDRTTHDGRRLVTREDEGYIFDLPTHRIRGQQGDAYTGGFVYTYDHQHKQRSIYKCVFIDGGYEQGIIAPMLRITDVRGNFLKAKPE